MKQMIVGSVFQWFLVLVVGVLLCGDLSLAEEENSLCDHIPKPGVFPPVGVGELWDGDFVMSDP